MSIVHDIWENELEITKGYVAHRHRLIDVNLIQTFQVKGRRLYINTFKQNEMVPSMCIFFENKEKAEEAYQMMKEVYYGPLVYGKQKQPELSPCLMLPIFLIAFSPLIGFLVLLVSSSYPIGNTCPLFLSS
jgi:hypothetical protein